MAGRAMGLDDEQIEMGNYGQYGHYSNAQRVPGSVQHYNYGNSEGVPYGHYGNAEGMPGAVQYANYGNAEGVPGAKEVDPERGAEEIPEMERKDDISALVAGGRPLNPNYYPQEDRPLNPNYYRGGTVVWPLFCLILIIIAVGIAMLVVWLTVWRHHHHHHYNFND